MESFNERDSKQVKKGDYMITFIHTADCHLGSPYASLQQTSPELSQMMQTATNDSFVRIIDTAIEKKVDFVVIAGDLYDSEVQSVKTIVWVSQQFERLREHGILVYLSYGNHDFQPDISLIDWPDNVHVFGPEVETMIYHNDQHESVAISGFSYATRWQKNPMVGLFPERNQATTYHIGMYHGFFDQLNSEHAHYAPFNLQEMMQLKYDYWALGHIHKREVLSTNPPVIYVGNIQGRHRNDSGEKGCYYVELGEKISYSFIPTQSYIWQKVSLDLKKASDKETLVELLNEGLEALKSQPIIIDLTLEVSAHFPRQLIERYRSPVYLSALIDDVHLAHLDWLIVQKPDKVLLSTSLLEHLSTQKNKLQQPVKTEEILKELWQNDIVSSLFPDLMDDQEFLKSSWTLAEQEMDEQLYYEGVSDDQEN